MLPDSEALSALAGGPPARRYRVRALITKMRARSAPEGPSPLSSQRQSGDGRQMREFSESFVGSVSRSFR